MGSLGQQSFCATTPHFFKIIVDNTSRDHKLELPKKFVKKYGADLSDSVSLKLPNGSEWEVKLARCNVKAWFESGWPEFSRFCSLDYGTFIVFQYKGNSQFEVCVLDSSATEIDYPLVMPKIEDEDDEISEEYLPCPPKRKKSPLVCPPFKKTRASSSGKAKTVSGNHKSPLESLHSHCSKAESEKKYDFPATIDSGGGSSSMGRFLKQTGHKNLGRMEPLTKTEKATALQRANAFKSNKPYFKKAMQPSYIHGNRIDLPYEFSRRHLNNLPAGIAILQVPDGRTWSVKFKYDLKVSRARFSGWSTFVRDNYLKVGDVCVFVLMDCNDLLFNACFFRTTEDTNCTFSPGSCRGANVHLEEKRSRIVEAKSSMRCKIDNCKKRRPKSSKQFTYKRSSCLRASRVGLEAANKFNSENPFFSVTLRSFHMKSNLTVPASFISSFIDTNRKQTVKLQVEDRAWAVNLVPKGKYSARLRGGWIAFAKEHGLVEGDVCIFELMEINGIVLKVHIIRSSWNDVEGIYGMSLMK